MTVTDEMYYCSCAVKRDRLISNDTLLTSRLTGVGLWGEYSTPDSQYYVR